MSRYTGEARITLNGDRALAARYISEGRKYLGGLMVTHPQATAVRELTNPDGVHFRVGYFGGVPFIQITAGSNPKSGTILGVEQGVCIAPIGVTNYTLYSPKPQVLINTQNGAYKKSLFSTSVSPLTSTSHPTDEIDVPFGFYDKITPNLASAWLSQRNRLCAAQRLYWHNKTKDLHLYCGRGVGYFSETPDDFSGVFLNGNEMVSVDRLYAIFPTANFVTITGCAAKRTPSGLRIIMSYARGESYDTGPYWLGICYADLVPTDQEKKRLDKIGAHDGIIGYAAEYRPASADDITIAYEHQIDKYYNTSGWSGCAFNQSATECRTFVWKTVNSGPSQFDLVSVDELVFDVSDLEDVSHEYVESQPITEWQSYYKAESSEECLDPNYKAEIASVPAPTLSAGVGSHYIAHTDTALGGSWTAYSGMLGPTPRVSYIGGYPQVMYSGFGPTADVTVPRTFREESYTKASPSIIRGMVDYVDDVPVYAYIAAGSKNDVTVAEQLSMRADTYATASISYTIADATPGVPGGEYFVGVPVSSSTSGISGESAFTMNRTAENKTPGIIVPLYEDGEEVGYWLDLQPAHTVTETSSGSCTFARDTVDNVSIKSVDMENSSSSSETRNWISIKHLDLKTKSAIIHMRRRETTESRSETWDDPGPADTFYFYGEKFSSASSSFNEYLRIVAYVDGAIVYDSGDVLMSTSGSSGSGSMGNSYWGLHQAHKYRFRDSDTPAYCVPSDIRTSPIFTTRVGSVPADAYPFTHSTLDYKLSDVLNVSPVYIDSTFRIEWGNVDDVYKSGLAVHKGSYILQLRIPSGYPVNTYSNYAASVFSNDSKDTDMLTGKHNAPCFTTPFLHSAYAVKIIQQ